MSQRPSRTNKVDMQHLSNDAAKAAPSPMARHSSSGSILDDDELDKPRDDPYRFLTVDEVPMWLRNPCQIEGYRAPYLSFKECAVTGLMQHNESWSIWTSFVVAVMFFVAIPYILMHPDHMGSFSYADKVGCHRCHLLLPC
jgi:hypothetical protein